MPYFAGFAIALVISFSATFVGLDKDRAFYPTVLAVVASYYVLFAAMGGSGWTVVSELFIMAAFVVAVVLGFKRSLWIVVAALAAHGVLDLFHGHVVSNPGVPTWWPMFCLTYDVSAAVYLAVRLHPPGRPHRRRAPGKSTARSLPSIASVAGGVSSAHSDRTQERPMESFGQRIRPDVSQRSAREVFGQGVRLVGAATKTIVGLVPQGNTGGTNVSAFRSVPVAPELQRLIDAARG